MKSVFVVQHMNVLPDGQEDVKFIGAYRSSESAHAAIERLKTQPGFCDHPRLHCCPRTPWADVGGGLV